MTILDFLFDKPQYKYGLPTTLKELRGLDELVLKMVYHDAGMTAGLLRGRRAGYSYRIYESIAARCERVIAEKGYDKSIVSDEQIKKWKEEHGI